MGSRHDETGLLRWDRGGLILLRDDGARWRLEVEVAALKVRDIDSERMLLRVERGKGGQYRNAMLPAGLLALLRE